MSVDIKFVISPTVNVVESTVEVTLRVFLRIVETIAPRILSPTKDINQLKCTLNNVDTNVAAKRAAAYVYLKPSMIINYKYVCH